MNAAECRPDLATTLTVSAEPDQVPVLRAFSRAHARRARCGPELTASIALAVSEAATNCVVHAYAGRPTGPIRVSFKVGSSELQVTVSDDGRGFGPRDDSPGLGLGLATIRHCCDALEVGDGPAGHGTVLAVTFAR